MDSSPTKTPSKKAPIAGRDAELMFRVIEALKTEKLDVDWDRVAAEMGYKSGSVAAVRFRQIRRTMKSAIGSSPASAGGSAGDVGTPVNSLAAKPAKVTKARVSKKPKSGEMAKAENYKLEEKPKSGEVAKAENSELEEKPKCDLSDNDNYEMVKEENVSN